MPEILNVNTGGIIASQWGNQIRDRTIQRYANAADRATEHPSPSSGDLSYLADTGDVDVFGPGGWQHIGTPAGTMVMWGAASPPNGWLLCQGQAISRTTFAALFAIYGTTYGSGDGSTTFNLPDLRQRFPLGRAASGTGATLGSTGGAINHTHTNPTTNSAGAHIHSQGSTGAAGAHSHSLSDNGHARIAMIGSNQLAMRRLATSNWTANRESEVVTHGSVSFTAGNGASLGGNTDSESNHSHTTPNVNSNGDHSHTQSATGANNPPFIAVNFAIKT